MRKVRSYIKIGCILFFGICSIMACSQQKTDNNMKWISKFDFFDLYKVRVNGGYFNPGSAIRLEEIAIPNENTILLVGKKTQRDFDNNPKSPSVAVLFASNDKGKTYKEILLNDGSFLYMEVKENYSLIESYTSNKEAIKLHKIQLLNNNTFELIKIDEFLELSNISYDNFDGKYVIKKNKLGSKLINLFDKKEEYEVPEQLLSKKRLHNKGNGKFIFMENQKIIQYDVKLKSEQVLKELKNQYDYFWADEDLLIKSHDEPYRLELFDLNEDKVSELDRENRDFYRYKNFMCDYSNIGSKPEIRYSYDYGKTWTTHHVQGFIILQNLFGFYKDQFLVTEGIFLDFDSPESGGRIMVGEFEK
ncbi:hypothetical protein [Empedobacter tilapiae]